MAGRATKLTPEVQEQIVSAIKAGNYACVAAQAAGIGVATFYEWLQRGEREGKRPLSPLYADFAEAVKRAEAESELRAVQIVQAAMPDCWQAAMTYLERRHPARWKRREEVDGTVVVELKRYENVEVDDV